MATSSKRKEREKSEDEAKEKPAAKKKKVDASEANSALEAAILELKTEAEKGDLENRLCLL